MSCHASGECQKKVPQWLCGGEHSTKNNGAYVYANASGYILKKFMLLMTFGDFVRKFGKVVQWKITQKLLFVAMAGQDS